MPFAARWFIVFVVSLGVVLAWLAIPALALAHDVWLTAAFWVILGLLSRTVVTRAGPEAKRHGDDSLNTPAAFASLLMLPWHAFVGTTLFVAVAHHLLLRPTHANNRPAWYEVAFNVAAAIVGGAASLWVLHACRWVVLWGITEPQSIGFPFALVALSVAVFIGVALKHLLLNTAVALVSRISWSKAGFLGPDIFGPSFLIALFGVPLALLWMLSPWTILPAIAPIALVRAAALRNLNKQLATEPPAGKTDGRRFPRLLETELGRTLRHNRTLGLLAFEVDEFNPTNGEHNRACGDSLLEQIRLVASGALRDYDTVAWLGASEFSVLLPETNAAQAELVAERLRTRIARERFDSENLFDPAHVTISVGVAAFPAHGVDSATLRESARRALRSAMQAGGNRTVMAHLAGARSKLPPANGSGGCSEGNTEPSIN